VRALCPVLSGPAPENSELEKKCGEFVVSAAKPHCMLCMLLLIITNTTLTPHIYYFLFLSFYPHILPRMLNQTYHTDDLYNKEDACVSIGLCTAGAVTIGPNSAAREVAPAASPVPVSSSSSSSSSGENDPEKKIAVRLNSADSAKPEQDKPEVVPTGIQKTGKQQLNWEPAPSADDAKAKAGPKSTKKTKALDQDMEDTSDVFR
jgi:hypothetical protein